ncbi:Protein kinase domain-containing protein [Mycena indigotica]|uniref:Protein kinase domain-containing protein n=1 Tax=Mycena indigotica TaxID=2126181 RepID=A0A8H6VR14_9AGAR|nr:Protein kinase domain-containing protein [Mycena indigotica]KAF7290549.1 Protein kinase domain-containing protein [Mycena indigotica]
MNHPQYHPAISGAEIFWAEQQPFLAKKGYHLRPRFSAHWRRKIRILPTEREDDIPSYQGFVLDATRIRDKKKVVLKRVETGDEELVLHSYLDSPALRSDPRNRTIPILEVFRLPETQWSILVTPYCREFDYPPFHCRQEFIDAMSQYLEGLEFMHEHNIAHIDIAPQNMLMDESQVVPKGSHFSRPRTQDGISELFCWNDRCSVGHVDYFYIDFGLSEYFPEGTTDARRIGRLRTFPEIPELSWEVPYNPFLVDVFQLGLTMHKLIYGYPSLEIFRPVADAMTARNPSERAKPGQSLAHLRAIAATIPPQELSSQIWDLAATEKHKRERATLGGYRQDYRYIRDEVLYDIAVTRPPKTAYMRPKATGSSVNGLN